MYSSYQLQIIQEKGVRTLEIYLQLQRGSGMFKPKTGIDVRTRSAEPDWKRKRRRPADQNTTLSGVGRREKNMAEITLSKIRTWTVVNKMEEGKK